MQQLKRINWDIDHTNHQLIKVQQEEDKRFEETRTIRGL